MNPDFQKAVTVDFVLFLSRGHYSGISFKTNSAKFFTPEGIGTYACGGIGTTFFPTLSPVAGIFLDTSLSVD